MQYLWETKQMVNRSIDYGNTFLGSVHASVNAPGNRTIAARHRSAWQWWHLSSFRNNNLNQRNSYISKSSDGGLTFNLVNLDDFDWMITGCPATITLGVVNGDSLLIVRRSGATGNDEIVYNNINKSDLNYSYINVDPVMEKFKIILNWLLKEILFLLFGKIIEIIFQIVS